MYFKKYIKYKNKYNYLKNNMFGGVMKILPSDTCCICLDIFGDQECVKLKSCNHIIHTDCFNSMRYRFCPICKDIPTGYDYVVKEQNTDNFKPNDNESPEQIRPILLQYNINININTPLPPPPPLLPSRIEENISIVIIDNLPEFLPNNNDDHNRMNIVRVDIIRYDYDILCRIMMFYIQSYVSTPSIQLGGLNNKITAESIKKITLSGDYFTKEMNLNLLNNTLENINDEIQMYIYIYIYYLNILKDYNSLKKYLDSLKK